MVPEYEKPTEKKKPTWEESDSSEEEEEEKPDPVETKPVHQTKSPPSAQVVESTTCSSKDSIKSPYGMFASSNKLSQFKSKFDPSAKKDSSLQCSKASGSQFKPVKGNGTQTRDDSFSQQSQQSIDLTYDNSCKDTESQRSNLNSIDTDSFPLSTDNDQCDKSDSPSAIVEPAAKPPPLPKLRSLASGDSPVKKSPASLFSKKKVQNASTYFYQHKNDSSAQNSSVPATGETTTPAGKSASKTSAKSPAAGNMILSCLSFPVPIDLKSYTIKNLIQRPTF